MLKLPLPIFLALALAGCGTTTEDASEIALLPLYVAVAIPAAITYPFWKTAAEAHEKKHLPKSRENIVGKHGYPTAKYSCQGVEIWEYGNEEDASKRQFVLLLQAMDSSVDLGKVSLLKDCSVIEGSPSQETKEFWLAEIVPCGRNYQRQVHDRDLFFVDMAATQGTVMIETFEPSNDIHNAGFVVMYEQTPIYNHPQYNFTEKIIGTRIEKLHFGPGESQFLEVRVTDKPWQTLFQRYYYDLRISCP